MQPVGTVVSVSNTKATVVLTRHSACSSCRACPMGHEASSNTTIQADNSVSARPGPKVVIDFDPRTSLCAATIVYVWPLVGLFSGYAVMSQIASSSWPTHVEGIGALGSIIGCLLAFLSLRLLEPKLQRNRRLMPVIKEIVDD